MKGEERSVFRTRLDQRCWIALTTDEPLIECMLRDVSPSGAKLVQSIEVSLPSNFDLYFTTDGRVARKCELAWQRGTEVGLRFIGRKVPAGGASGRDQTANGDGAAN
jgi:hypothetical protein